MEKKNGFDLHSVLTAFGIGFPLFIALAPKDFRGELLEYIGKWVGFFIALAVGYLVWGIIKDKRRHKKEREQ